MYNVLILTVATLTITSALLIYTLSRINNKKFKIICELYYDKFKKLPIGASALYHSSSFFYNSGYGLKIDFIVRPLISKKKSILSDNDEDVYFIRNLDKKLTNSFIVEFYLGVITTLLLVLLGLAIYFLR